MRMCSFVCGIDVGTNSVGLAAIEVDSQGMPIGILNSVVVLHDSGVDPDKQKYAITRLANSGVARRARRLVAQKRKRLARLDAHLQALGWPIVDLESQSDPYLPWKVRARLATTKLEGEELFAALSIAVRHIARHRGWRNPYSRIESLFVPQPASDQLAKLKERVTEQSGVIFDDDATPAEVIVDLGLSPLNRVRDASADKYGANSIRGGKSIAGQSKTGVLGGKLMQSDNAGEILKIARRQGLDESLTKDLIRWVFDAKSPKGSSGERVGKDPLPGQGGKSRASKAHPAFQEYRIISVIANLRINDGQTKRHLTPGELDTVTDLLMSADGSDGVTWNDVAEALDIARSKLIGTASLSAEGERASSFPPSNATNRAILSSKIKPLIAWWNEATPEEQEALTAALSNSDVFDDSTPEALAVSDFLSAQSDEILAKLDELSLPKGRAAYSVDSLRKLTAYMRAHHTDVHEARKAVFGVDESWVPPSDPIGMPVGNPAVDRVLKIVNRWILAVQRKWGTPISINIENVRSGFSSEAQVREYERDLNKRRQRNQSVIERIQQQLGRSDQVRSSDIARFLAIERQRSQCLYCGTTITFRDSQMDHIVPRAGAGSTNTRDNLVAVCERCNKAKSNTPFAVWAARTSIPGVSLQDAVERVRFWLNDEGLSKIQNANYKKDVIARLYRVEKDEPIDGRSIESVAWMANELRDRISSHFRARGTAVRVSTFRGSVTASARRASGLENKIQFVGGTGKTRFDRRHHAMDAAVIALMSQYVAQTLSERESLCRASFVENAGNREWRDYRGNDTAHKLEYGKWLNRMDRLAFLLNDAIAADKIPVTQNIRLRYGDSVAHSASVQKMATKRVGDSWTRTEIDQASTPQMWIALSRDPDFSDDEGLPENPERRIRIKDRWYGSNDEVEVFPKKIAAIALRGGWAEVGGTIHHARLYRLQGKKGIPTYGMIRVFGPDLLRHRNDDLFNVTLGPETLAMRDAKPEVRRAVLADEAEYLGWILPGSEFELDLSSPIFQKNAIGDLLRDFPGTTHWTVKGFMTNSKITLKPTYLAAEGLERVPHGDGSSKIIDKTGWRVAVPVLFQASTVKLINRTALGYPRTTSASSLPVSFALKE